MDRVKQTRYDNLYMDIALRIAQMSFAKKRQVGAVAVKDNNILSFGFNGTPTGFPNICEDDYGKTMSHVIHAEANLIAKAAAEGLSLKGATVYVTTAPCDTCANLLLQSRVSRIVFKDYYKTDSGIIMLDISKVKVEKYGEYS